MDDAERPDGHTAAKTQESTASGIRTPAQVRETLEQLIRDSGTDYSGVSRFLGRNPSYIQQFMHRGTPRRLSAADRAKLATFFGTSQYNLGGEEPAESNLQMTAMTAAEDQTPANFLFIPSYDIAASAGHGQLVDQEVRTGALAFRRDWIKSVSNAPPEDLAVVRVDGDSMYPTLAHGDHILIDRQQTEPVRDGIYVLRIDDALQIKRLLIHPGTRKIKIKSDNPLYDQWNECDAESLVVLGRAVWVGRRL